MLDSITNTISEFYSKGSNWLRGVGFLSITQYEVNDSKFSTVSADSFFFFDFLCLLMLNQQHKLIKIEISMSAPRDPAIINVGPNGRDSLDFVSKKIGWVSRKASLVKILAKTPYSTPGSKGLLQY